MNKKQKNQLIWAGVILGVVVLVSVLAFITNRPGELDSFAQCLEEKGVTFYGAFWCPHCQEQKKMFGNSARLLPYVECSQPDGKTQTQVCIDKKIESYP